jgi:hypothetical protein
MRAAAPESARGMLADQKPQLSLGDGRRQGDHSSMQRHEERLGGNAMQADSRRATANNLSYMMEIPMPKSTRSGGIAGVPAPADIEDRKAAEDRLQRENVALREEIDKSRCSKRSSAPPTP